MKKLIIILLFAATASASLFINSFNSGQLGKDLKSRHDLDRTSMGSEELENILIRPQGMAFRRPGTEFIDTELGEIATAEVLGDYPTLETTTAQVDPGLTHTTAISDLDGLEAMTITGAYYLTQDIDASATSDPTYNGGEGWIPIGTFDSPFRGTFDGCGYTISNLYINRDNYDQGLFGRIGHDSPIVHEDWYCIIANLTLADINYTVTYGRCGGIFGYGATYTIHTDPVYDGRILIQNCHVSGTITIRSGDDASSVGGIGGAIGRYSTSTKPDIYDCTFTGTIDMNGATYGQAVGGILGSTVYPYGAGVVISNCYSTGTFANLPTSNVNNSRWGGLIGISTGSEVSYCYSTTDIDGYGDYVGGLIGQAGSGASIEKCYATGDIAGAVDYVGGFVGYGGGTITDCYATGSVEGERYVGGFTGRAGTIENCYSTGVVLGTEYYFGGFSGGSGTFTSCYWDEETSGTEIDDNEWIGEVEGKLTCEMNQQATFADWDFDTIWTLEDEGACAENVDVSGTIRLIPFEYSTDDAYVLELGHQYVGFLRTAE